MTIPMTAPKTNKLFILSGCSVADLPKSVLDAHHISFLPFHVLLDDKEYNDDLGKSLPLTTFYKRMTEGAMPKTSQPNSREYELYFDSLLQTGCDVLHICFSSGLSGAYQSAVTAQRLLTAKYPTQRLIVLDSLCASAGYGMLLLQLAKKKEAGESILTLATFVRENALRIHHWFFSSDLSAYIRGGRVSRAAGIVGSALGICPVLNMDAEGHLTPRARAIGKKRAIKELVNRMEQYADGGTAYRGMCYISHSASYDDALELKRAVEEKFINLPYPPMIVDIGTVIGAHTGVGTLALFFFGRQRED